jgi:hypothetical protein
MCKTHKVRDKRDSIANVDAEQEDKGEDLLDDDAEDFAPMLKNLYILLNEKRLAGTTRRESYCLDTGLKPRDIDNIAEEISQVFESSAVKEKSNISDDDHIGESVCLMVTIYALVQILKNQGEEDDNAKSCLLLLLRNTIATPSNLENLLCMTDAETRTDSTIRITAFEILHDLTCSISVIRMIKLKDGSCFFSSFISAICKGLDGNGDAANRGNKKQTNRKKKIRTQYRQDLKQLVQKLILWHSLVMALYGAKEKPTQLLDCIDSFNWPRMFNLEAGEKASERLFVKLKMFRILHSLAVSVLQEDHGNIKAKRFLQKLGRCHGLFRGVLSSVIAGKVFSKPMPAESSNTSSARLQAIGIIMDFLLEYNLCLIPSPRDGGTFSLVRRAYSALEHEYKSCSAHDAQESSNLSVRDKFMYWNPDTWKGVFQNESDQDCWERFKELLLSSDDENFDPKQWRKDKRRHRRDSQKEYLEKLYGQDTMCANCFVLERDLKNKLMKCSCCRRLTYCSVDCQKKHWKKAHKKQCNK